MDKTDTGRGKEEAKDRFFILIDVPSSLTPLAPGIWWPLPPPSRGYMCGWLCF